MSDSVDWARLSALYDEGAALPADQREAWLQRQNGPLRERLARMLATLDDGTGLAALRDSVAAALPAASRLQAGEQLGAWQLLAPLGEGGMGQVWRARRADGLYQAEAAIKLLRADLGGAELAARFARERRLLGRLQHPGIARLLDAGLDDRYGAYLVIELVDGQPLNQAARSLGVAARVRLLVQVAQAVQAAHAQLIVHRDLKPANVLVNAQGVPKLLDFGIATLLDDETHGGVGELTRLAGGRLTPAYAAPEQVAGGDVGTTTDVFALGVLLYELLTGALPQGPQATTRVQLEHALLHQAPLRFAEQLALPARTEGPGRPADAKAALGDLEAVCAKALRKRASDRYPSVGDFIADLERWRADLPVSVRREDWQHRTRLWLRRHRALAGGSALLLLTLAGGLGASLWQRQRALEAAREAEQVSLYLTELLEAASPDRHGNRPPTVLELLEEKRAELPQRFATEPAVKDRVLRTLVATYLGLNRFDIAFPLAEQRVAHSARWGLDDPRHEDARVALARLHTALGNGEPVVQLLEPLLPVYRRRHGLDHGETATVRQQLALAYARNGQFEPAERLLTEEEESVQRRPGDAFLRAFHANYTHVLSTHRGQLALAERQMLAAAPSFALASSRHQRFARVMERNLAVAQWRMLRDDAERAIARSDALIARADALLGRGNNLVGSLRAALAEYLQSLDLSGPALAQLQAAEADAEAAGVHHPLARLGRQIAWLAAHVRHSGRSDAAQLATAQAHLRTLDGEPAFGGTHRADALLQLGRVASAADDAAAGLALTDALLKRLDRLPLRPYWASQAEGLRADWAARRGELAVARAAAERAAALIDQLPEPQGLLSWATWLRLAQHQHAQGLDPGPALARAAALRPAALDAAMAGRPHPLDAWHPGRPWPRGF